MVFHNLQNHLKDNSAVQEPVFGQGLSRVVPDACTLSMSVAHNNVLLTEPRCFRDIKSRPLGGMAEIGL